MFIAGCEISGFCSGVFLAPPERIQRIKITTTNKMKPTSRWNDRVKCTICGKIVSRSNQSNHRKSNQHQIYLKMNEKIRKLLID